MDKIIISDLLASGVIGVKHPERDQPQDLLINLVLYVDLRKAGISDSINDTINYSTIAKMILAEISTTSFYTVEALAEYLAQFILEKFNPTAIKLKVEKTQVVKAARRVGVEIKRYRRDQNI